MLNKKQIEQLSSVVGSLATFGATGFITLVYVTDWKCICRYIPFYNSVSGFVVSTGSGTAGARAPGPLALLPSE